MSSDDFGVHLGRDGKQRRRRSQGFRARVASPGDVGKRLLSLLVLGIVLGSATGWADELPAPHFFISNLRNQRFNSRLWSEPIVVSFFFIDCLPCRRELPQLYRLIRDRYPQVKLLLVDPIPTDNREDLQTFAGRLEIPLDHFYQDSLGVIARKMGVDNRFPTMVGLRQGRYLFRVYDLEAESLKIIDQALR